MCPHKTSWINCDEYCDECDWFVFLEIFFQLQLLCWCECKINDRWKLSNVLILDKCLWTQCVIVVVSIVVMFVSVFKFEPIPSQLHVIVNASTNDIDVDILIEVLVRVSVSLNVSLTSTRIMIGSIASRLCFITNINSLQIITYINVLNFGSSIADLNLDQQSPTYIIVFNLSIYIQGNTSRN